MGYMRGTGRRINMLVVHGINCANCCGGVKGFNGCFR